MSNTNVLREIARLESEVTRIQRELDALRQQVTGVSSVRRTQSFPSVDGVESAPQPSVPVKSEPVRKSDRRMQTGGRTGLSEYPPSTERVTPARRPAATDPAAGRYEYVGEGSSRRRR